MRGNLGILNSFKPNPDIWIATSAANYLALQSQIIGRFLAKTDMKM